MPKTLKGE